MSARLSLVVLLGLVVAAAGSGWRTGRATFYGDQPWLWSIHEGSCGFGQLDYNRGTGYDIAAMPDVHYEYHSGACGRCYEVKCDPKSFTDNYGNTLDRTGACYDPERTVVVTISDTCPCNYADNHYSNKRWCCGDMDHLDISVYTYDKLADRKWGVIGLQYRPIECPNGPAGGFSPSPAEPQQASQQNTVQSFSGPSGRKLR